MKKYPLKISYAAKTALWAGKRLSEEYGKISEHDRISETWELSVRRDDEAVVLCGEAQGMKLSEYFDACGYACVTPTYKKGDRFPLLIKLIDADDTLSVQVHPDDEYARVNEGEYGKTEMWYIVDALPGAQLVYGFKDYDKESFKQAVAEGTLEKHLNYVDVHKGDVFFIPSGCVHAIGAGILIAEIQQSSNVTYRVYDYNRRGADGKLRPLHVEKALDVIVDYTEDQINAIRYEDGYNESYLANCKYFKVEHLFGSCTLNAERSFIHVLCLDGEGTIDGNTAQKGDSFFIPKGCENVVIEGNLEIITSESK